MEFIRNYTYSGCPYRFVMLVKEAESCCAEFWAEPSRGNAYLQSTNKMHRNTDTF